MDRMRWMFVGALVVLLGAVAAWRWWERPAREPDGPALLERVRSIARLETLEVEISKTVSFAPDPKPSESLVGDVLTWAKYELAPPEGRAIVFAKARLGLDLDRLDAHAIAVHGDTLDVILPPLVTTVELDPERTEIVHSNLDSAETAQLLAKAQRELQMEVERDASLARKAKESASRAIQRVLVQSGFREVRLHDGPAGAI